MIKFKRRQILFFLILFSLFSLGRTDDLRAASPASLTWVDDYENNSWDGVFPNRGNEGDKFIFKVKYIDPLNSPPGKYQVWINLNKNSEYDDSEKFDLQEVSEDDQVYTDGKNYTLTKKIADTGSFNYRFFFQDLQGREITRGNPVNDSSFSVLPRDTANQPPLLSYESGKNGVDCLNNNGGPCTFSVIYTDSDGDIPLTKEVWIDLDNSNSFEKNEKFSMEIVSDKGSTYATGRIYELTQSVFYSGDGLIGYKFNFNDGEFVAAGAPAEEGPLSLNKLQLLSEGNVPYLESATENELGISPAEGRANFTLYTFKVKYFDADDDPPFCPFDSSPCYTRLLIDLNHDGSYTEEENFEMSPENEDTSYTDGKVYTYSQIIKLSLDSELPWIFYRFYFSDGKNIARGPLSKDNKLLFLPNTAPRLKFAGAGRGITPETGDSGSEFFFTVTYQDEDNDPAKNAQVWLDLNGDGEYTEGAEKFDLIEEETGGNSYLEGKNYSLTRVLAYQGTEEVKYRFYFDDGDKEALGPPAQESEENILILLKTARPQAKENGSGANNGGNCFIATAAYGSSLAPQVIILKEFRDKYLPEKLVNLYYRYSPPAANFLRKYNFLRSVVRLGLLPLILICLFILKTTLIQKSILFLTLGGMGYYTLIKNKKIN